MLHVKIRRLLEVFAMVALLAGYASASSAEAQVRAPAFKPSAAPPLNGLTNTLGVGRVDALDLHQIRFTVGDTIPVTAAFRITYPAGFDLNSTTGIYADSLRPDLPGVSNSFDDFQSFWIYLDSSGTPAPAGTTLRLLLTPVRNDTLAGSFQVSVEVFDGDGTLLFGPTLSVASTLFPGPAVSLAIAPNAADTMLAGDTRSYTARVADSFGNAIDTATVLYRVEPGLLGDMTGSVLAARVTGSGEVIASYGPLSDTTGSLEVLPGPLASWTMSGVPAGSRAGAAMPTDSVVLTGKDAFGNVAFTYQDSLYFATSDSTAVLPATATMPFILSPGDAGRVAFPGSSFTWFKAGVDTLYATGGGAQAYASLVIAPDTALDFQLFAPDSVAAGVPFTIDAIALVDRFGNSASGQISLFTSSNDSAAPGGQLPNLPDLSAANGAGQSRVILYNAGAYPVFGRLGGSTRQTTSITILPAPVASFEWLITEPITAGIKVDSPFTLTALDDFRNVDDLFASRGSTVLLSSSGGAVSPSSIAPASFAAGRASLHALNFTYTGSGGLVNFVAQAGLATGSSVATDVQAFFVDSLILNESLLRRGVDTLSGRFQIRIAGSGTATVTGLELLTSQGNFPLASLAVTPTLPVGITGPTTTDLSFRWLVPGSLSAGTLAVSCAVFAQFPTASVTDSCAESTSVVLTSASQLSMVTLVPDTVAYDDVRYGLQLTNTGPTSVSIRLDSTHLILSNGPRADTATAVMSGPLTMGPADVVDLEFTALHAAPFAGDMAVARLHFVGTELGHPIADSLTFPTPIEYVAPVDPAYIAGTLEPDTLVAGRADTLRLRLSQGGGVTVFDAQISPTWMELRGTSDTVRVNLDNTLTPLTDWTPGDTTLAFPLTQADTRLAPGKYQAAVQISGRHNRLDTTLTIVAGDSLLVAAAPSLRVNDVRILLAARAPQVSVGQSFVIEADIENTGMETLDSVGLRLTSDDSSVFIDTLTMGMLLVGDTQSVQWAVTAHTDSVILETFRVEITGAWGRNSGSPATVEPALVDFVSIQIQTQADVSVWSRIVSPSDALDGRIAAGSPFTVAGLFLNSGQAITSSADLIIRVTGGLELNNFDTILVPVGIDANWSITAPDFDTTAQIIIELLNPPQELNTGDPALVKAGADTIDVLVVFETPPLRVTNVQSSGGATNGPYVPLEWQWSNEDLTGLFPILVQSLQIEAVSGDGVTPVAVTDIISSAHLEFPNDTVIGMLSNSTVTFGVDSLRRVRSGNTEPVRFYVVPRSTGSLQEFRWSTRSTLWRAIERSVGGSGLSVNVLDERGQPLNVTTELAFIPGSDAANYPNPFRAGAEVTSIQYELPQAAAVNITIYTTSGREVWRFDAPAGGPGGQAGSNTVAWDGRNGDERVVVDGIYIARITGPGLDASVKIAVIK